MKKIEKIDANSISKLFPQEKTDLFFEALFGNAKEGAYDIELVYKGMDDSRLYLEFQLKQRAGRCLSCNLTSGLPEVFRRHPVIDLSGLVHRIRDMIGGGISIKGYRLGHTLQYSSSLHVIPFEITLEQPK